MIGGKPRIHFSFRCVLTPVSIGTRLSAMNNGADTNTDSKAGTTTWAPIAMAYVETEQGATGAILEVLAPKPTRYSTTGPQLCPCCAHRVAGGCGYCDHTTIAQCECGEVSTLTDGVTDETERVWRCNACDAKWLADEEANGPSVVKCEAPAAELDHSVAL